MIEYGYLLNQKMKIQEIRLYAGSMGVAQADVIHKKQNHICK